MARAPLYPEGSTTMNVVLPASLKVELQALAVRERLSLSAFITRALEDWLKEHVEAVGA